MNCKTTFLALFLYSLGISAQSVDCRFMPVENTCDTEQYCVNIEVSSNDGADLLGSSSIRFSYDADIVIFEGTSMEGIEQGSYVSVNFDGDQNTLSDDCADLGGTPYTNHSFDGGQPEDFLLTWVLLVPTSFGTPAACPAIDNGWTVAGRICFDVLDADGDPNLKFSGTENGAVEDLTGTNFNDDADFPNKYDNGSFGELHTSFNEFCNGITPPPTPGGPKITKISPSLFDDVDDFYLPFPGLGKTDMENEISLSFKSITVSPVPTKDILTVTYQSTVSENMTLSIYDISGKILTQKEYISQEGNNVLSIDLSQEPSGIYLLQLNNGTEKITKNIIK